MTISKYISPLQERLSLLSTTGSSSATSPRTDALTQLLVQGLHSSDARILDSVLDRADVTVTLAAGCQSSKFGLGIDYWD